MTRPGRTVADLVFDGRLDVLLAGGLGLLCLGLGLAFNSEPLEVAADIAACAAAAATARWPRAAGLALTVIVYAYVAAPVNWAVLGAYATLIPILCTGLRDQRVARRWFTLSYLAVVPALVQRESPGISAAVFGTMVWGAIIALTWFIGNLFAAYRRAAAREAAAAVAERQIAVARDLHDTVARTLSSVVLQARRQQADGDPTAFEDLLTGCEVALSELRAAMLAMRVIGDQPTETPGRGRSLKQVLDEATSLALDGGTPVVAIEGPLTGLDADVEQAVVAALDEALVNVNRHGACPCTIIATTSPENVEIVVVNQVASASASEHFGVGLLGARERMEKIGGILDAHKEGDRWLTRIAVPSR